MSDLILISLAFISCVFIFSGSFIALRASWNFIFSDQMIIALLITFFIGILLILFGCYLYQQIDKHYYLSNKDIEIINYIKVSAFIMITWITRKKLSHT